MELLEMRKISKGTDRHSCVLVGLVMTGIMAEVTNFKRIGPIDRIILASCNCKRIPLQCWGCVEDVHLDYLGL